MTTINSQEELLRALRENPKWKDAVRALILAEGVATTAGAVRRVRGGAEAGRRAGGSQRVWTGIQWLKR